MMSDRISEIGNEPHTITQSNIGDKYEGGSSGGIGGDKYKNDEWRRRDFDDDYIKTTLNEFKTTVNITFYLKILFVDLRTPPERNKRRLITSD